MVDELDQLTRRERKALSALLTAAVARAGRDDLCFDFDRLIADAPIAALPDAAFLHRVSGLSAEGLADATALPGGVRDELELEREEAGIHHLMILGALASLATRLRAAEIPFLVMKGPVLAARLYEHPGDRTYTDIDLLVPDSHFAAAINELEDLEYAHSTHDWARALEVMAGQISLMSPMIDIDLHWHLHYSASDRRPFSIDPKAMLERRVEVDLSGVRVPALDPVDRILVLCFHAARSGGHRLVWLKDIERTLSLDRPDLDDVARRAEAMRLAPLVGLVLRRARTVLAAPVDDTTIDRLLPTSLRMTEEVALRLSGPAQMHDRDTAVRFLSRSIRPTLWRAVSDIPTRTIKSFADHRHRLTNETDDPTEKAAFLAAVASTR